MFEAVPVEEWHSFKPTIKYNNLNAEEAEEEFARFVCAAVRYLRNCLLPNISNLGASNSQFATFIRSANDLEIIDFT